MIRYFASNKLVPLKTIISSNILLQMLNYDDLLNFYYMLNNNEISAIFNLVYLSEGRSPFTVFFMAWRSLCMTTDIGTCLFLNLILRQK